MSVFDPDSISIAGCSLGLVGGLPDSMYLTSAWPHQPVEGLGMDSRTHRSRCCQGTRVWDRCDAYGQTQI